MKVYSAVVSRLVPAGFAAMAQAAEHLPGQKITDGRLGLTVDGQVGTGFAGAIRFGGVLRTSALLPPVKVEVVVSPWSAGESEVSIQPISRLGDPESFRATRFFDAAHSIIPKVIDRVRSELPFEASPRLQLAA